MSVYACGVYKVFILCNILGGSFVSNIELTETKYFSLNEMLEKLTNEKANLEQITMCFNAFHGKCWQT